MITCNKNKVKVTNYECNTFTKTLEDKYSKIYNTQENIDLGSIISACTYSFTISNISRLMTTMIMELKDSYSEQSLRYCVLDNNELNMYKSVKLKSEPIHNKFMEYLNIFSEIYIDLTQLKEDVVIKGRPKREHYKYEVLPEEARMLLPVSICTNMMISLTGDALLSLYELMNANPMFTELKEEINTMIGFHSKYYDKKSIQNLKQQDEYTITPESLMMFNNEMEEFAIIDNPLHRTTSAIKVTSNTMYDTEKMIEIEKEFKIVDNVMCNSQHTSVGEHTFITTKQTLSMVAYQQLIRHRHINVTRYDSTKYQFDLMQFNKLANIDIYKYIPVNKSYTYNGMSIDTLFRDYVHFMLSAYSLNSLDQMNEYALNIFPVEFVLVCNLVAYGQVSSKRMCNCAQPEISNLFRTLYNYLVHKDDYLGKLLEKIATPKCYLQKCTEGKMSCGKPMLKKDLTTIR